VTIANVPHVHLKDVSDDELLSHVYSAADVFVAPSLQDNLPNTVLEAMACGTPVVAFGVGGIPEAVRHGETGFVVAPRDSAGLGRAMLELLSSEPMRAKMSGECRRIATEEYGIELQARRYAALYREIAPAAVRVARKIDAGETPDEKQQVGAQAAT
jgi:glycosyltransferase involved in cell wall biosynthesis